MFGRRLVYSAAGQDCQNRRRHNIDAKLIATSRVRLAEVGLTNSTFVEADAYDLGKVVVEPADYIFLANAFHGVPDKPRLASAVRGSLKDGGLFAIVNWHARSREERACQASHEVR